MLSSLKIMEKITIQGKRTFESDDIKYGFTCSKDKHGLCSVPWITVRCEHESIKSQETFRELFLQESNVFKASQQIYKSHKSHFIHSYLCFHKMISFYLGMLFCILLILDDDNINHFKACFFTDCLFDKQFKYWVCLCLQTKPAETKYNKKARCIFLKAQRQISLNRCTLSFYQYQQVNQLFILI